MTVTRNKPASNYIVTRGEAEHRVGVAPDGAVTLDGQVREVHLESVDGVRLFSLLVGDRSYEVFVEPREGEYSVTVEGERYRLRVAGERSAGSGGPVPRGRPEPRAAAGASIGRGVPGGSQAAGAAVSPMTGVLVELLVAEGQPVKAGEGVAILEAMKTRNVIRATRDGVVAGVQVAVGQTIRMDQVILYIDAAAGAAQAAG